MRVNSGGVSRGLGQSGVPGTVSHSGNGGNRSVESVYVHVCLCVFACKGVAFKGKDVLSQHSVPYVDTVVSPIHTRSSLVHTHRHASTFTHTQ